MPPPHRNQVDAQGHQPIRHPLHANRYVISHLYTRVILIISPINSMILIISLSTAWFLLQRLQTQMAPS